MSETRNTGPRQIQRKNSLGNKQEEIKIEVTKEKMEGLRLALGQYRKPQILLIYRRYMIVFIEILIWQKYNSFNQNIFT